jgi:hypothetical protein
LKIDSGDPAHAESGFLEIVSDDFPVLRSMLCGTTDYIYF